MTVRRGFDVTDTDRLARALAEAVLEIVGSLGRERRRLADARARIEADITETERRDTAPSAMSEIHFNAGELAGLRRALELLEEISG